MTMRNMRMRRKAPVHSAVRRILQFKSMTIQAISSRFIPLQLERSPSFDMAQDIKRRSIVIRKSDMVRTHTVQRARGGIGMTPTGKLRDSSGSSPPRPAEERVASV